MTEDQTLEELKEIHRAIYQEDFNFNRSKKYLVFFNKEEFDTWCHEIQVRCLSIDLFPDSGNLDNTRAVFNLQYHLYIDKRCIGASGSLIIHDWATSTKDPILKEHVQQYSVPEHKSWYVWYATEFNTSQLGALKDVYPEINTEKVKLEMSLLKILRHLKKQNPETYFNDSSNKVHPLLLAHYQQLPKEKKTKFLQVCSKFLGYEIQFVTYNHIRIPSNYPKLMPLKSLKSFHTAFGLSWVPKHLWEQAYLEDNLRKCAYTGDWFWRGCTCKVFFYDENGSRTFKYVGYTNSMPLTRHKNINKCYVEEVYYDIKDLKWSPELEQYACKNCHSQISLSNPKPKLLPITGYHTHSSNWRFLIQRTTNKNDQKTLPMGIELEMQSKEKSEEGAQMAARRIYESQLEINPNYNNFYFEWDGSLNPGGFELISNPMTMQFHQQYWPQLMPTIKQVALGWDVTGKGIAINDYYGIHITTHRKYWQDLWLARLGKFLSSFHNRDLVHAIAQRATIYGGGNKQLAEKSNTKISDTFAVIGKKLVESQNGHYDFIYLKEDRLVEIRIFRSTLNLESFLKNIEFVDSFRKWCQETAFSFSAEDYLKWLIKKENHKAYPNLLSYLSRDKFACKRRDVFPNPFKHFMKDDFKKGQRNLFEFEVTKDTPPLAALGYEDEADVLLHKDDHVSDN